MDHDLPFSASPPSITAKLAVLLLLAFALLSAGTAQADAPKLPTVMPEDVGMSAAHLNLIDGVVAEALEEQKMPGCVVAIGHGGGLAFLRAYGNKQLQPEVVPMTTDTVFDLASLTKPIATATSVMLLLERGKLRLRNDVADYIPEFGQNEKDDISVFQLLTHQGGLIPDNALKDYKNGPEEAFQNIHALPTYVTPGTKFVYTDVGFIMLGELVQTLSGKNVAAFAAENIYAPLGMTETGYLPKAELQQRAATTQQRDGHWMQGEVHDPRAYRLGGIAGHAGLFSTATDLAIYAQMLLNGGEYKGVRILSAATVNKMIAPNPVSSGQRGLGWDILTGYSSNRGELMSASAFGHGGFTGTSLWIDPELDLFVIFLSNRVHPDGKGSVNSVAGTIGTIAAAAIRATSSPAVDEVSHTSRNVLPTEDSTPGDCGAKDASASSQREVLSGIDVLVKHNFQQLKGRRVGLITNQSGLSRDGKSTIRLLHDAADVELVALFSPEHGLEGKLDVPKIADAQDGSTGLHVYSLYGATRKPTTESMADFDTLVFDIQDIGTRFYTFVSTMGNAMQAAAENNKRFVVLDRPNPINGIDVAGPVLDAGRESFVGYHTIPVRHGMTIGELARMFQTEMELEIDLQVITVEGWSREQFFDSTGLRWVNPSPNMRNLNEALLYPGVGLLETTNLSVGRGTDTPFEILGSPWLDGTLLAKALNGGQLAGVRFVPVQFTPESSKFKEETCGGVQILITNRTCLNPTRVGFEIAHQLRAHYPEQWDAAKYDRLLGNQATLDAVLAGKTVAEIETGYSEGLKIFRERRAKFLLYP